VITNFNRSKQTILVKLPDDLLKQLNLSGKKEFKDLLSNTKFNTDDISSGVQVTLPATGGMLLEF
jgi:hypothetical protein